MTFCELCDKPALEGSQRCEDHLEQEPPAVRPAPTPVLSKPAWRPIGRVPLTIAVLLLGLLWAYPEIQRYLFDEPASPPTPAATDPAAAPAQPAPARAAAAKGAADAPRADGGGSAAACGNGSVEPGEECDGQALAGSSCASLGFAGNCDEPDNCVKAGLTCLPNCRFDYSGCTATNQAALPRFITRKDGTATDRLTDLTWEMKCVELECDERHNVLARLAWKAAATEWVNGLNQEKFAGHNDWRLPTVEELRSLLLAVPPCATEPCQAAVWPRNQTATAGYWSSTSFALDKHRAWAVSFLDGNVYTAEKGEALHVRAVRRGS